MDRGLQGLGSIVRPSRVCGQDWITPSMFPEMSFNTEWNKLQKEPIGAVTRVVPDTDLAGYPAAGYPAINFAGYRISGRISG